MFSIEHYRIYKYISKCKICMNIFLLENLREEYFKHNIQILEFIRSLISRALAPELTRNTFKNT